MKSMNGIKIRILFNICLAVMLERNAMPRINRKYSSKSLKRVMGVRIIQTIMARKEMIFDRGSRFSKKPGILSIAQPQFHRSKTTEQ